MRIAICGTHYAGKTTLAEDLVEHYPDFELVEEPYHLMEEDGHYFSSPPALEDFEDQLRYSLKLISQSSENSIFDRSPLDFVAYALSHYDADNFDVDEWRIKLVAAVEQLDLIIFVPLDENHEIDLPASEDRELRQNVDEKLRQILVDDSFDLGLSVLEVFGDRHERLQMVLQYISMSSSKNGASGP